MVSCFANDMRACAAPLMLLLALPLSAQSADGGAAVACGNCGVVVSIAVSTTQEHWTPLGVVTASPSMMSGESVDGRSVVAFGPGGKRELVVIGAAGGAVYSRRPTNYQKRRWDVTVKMDDGAQRVLPQAYEPFFREGDRVRIMGTQLELVER
jgi:outer membrane lipoprotein SlyB